MYFCVLVPSISVHWHGCNYIYNSTRKPPNKQNSCNMQSGMYKWTSNIWRTCTSNYSMSMCIRVHLYHMLVQCISTSNLKLNAVMRSVSCGLLSSIVCTVFAPLVELMRCTTQCVREGKLFQNWTWGMLPHLQLSAHLVWAYT